MLAFALAACAGPRAELPLEGETLTEGNVVELRVHGLLVLVKTLPRQPLTTCELYVRGGVRNWTAANAGVEKLALTTALSGGTESLPKAAFQARLALLGTQLVSDSGEDDAVIGFKSLDRTFGDSFALLADAFLHPALPASEIELQRSLMLSELSQEEDDPDAALLKASHAQLYSGLPYAWRATGTPETLKALTRADLDQHLASLRETSRLLLVVVGNVDPAQVKAAVEAAFAGVPIGDYRETKLQAPTFKAASLTAVERALPTHYVVAAFPAPTFGDPDLAVGIVAMSALHDKLFEEVRTKRDLSYAPGAGLLPHGIGEGYLYVTAVDAPKTLGVMRDVLKSYQSGGLDAEQLEGSKRIFLTGFLMQEEPPGGQAELLARAQIVGGDWRLARDLPKRVASVTPGQVADFLNRYVRNLQTVVLGPAGLKQAF